jgi:4-methyl-5(b-hydroxyethyl)-thiazole monophosphate biosynthesis
MNRTVLVPLAEGFEEIEAVTVIDVLRRAGVTVVTASVGDEPVKGAHGLSVGTDMMLEACRHRTFDAIVLPGGMPGAAHLAQSPVLEAMVREQARSGRLLAAICAAPAVALQGWGLLKGRGKVAAYPTFRERLDEENRSDEGLSVGTGLITAAGPGLAMDFALALAAALTGPERADELARAMLVR